MGISQSQIVRHTSLESTYIPIELRRDVLKVGKYVCAFCYTKEKHDLCHDLPKCRGGKTELYNLLVCCQACRRKKDVKTASEFKQELIWERRATSDLPEVVLEPVWIEIQFLDGEVLKGYTHLIPGKKCPQFLRVHPKGDNKQVFVNLGAVKKIIFRKETDLIELPVETTKKRLDKWRVIPKDKKGPPEKVGARWRKNL